MSKTVSAMQLVLVGIAAVSGLMAGTCVAVRHIMKTPEARWAIAIGYAVIGAAFGALSVALGEFVNVLDVNTGRQAILAGLTFGALGTVVTAGANLGSIITFKCLGMSVRIERDREDDDAGD